jgi:hypothetical protein
VARFLDQVMQSSITDATFEELLKIPMYKRPLSDPMLPNDPFFLYTVKGKHKKFSFDFAFSILTRNTSDSDSDKERILSNIDLFVNSGKYFDGKTADNGKDFFKELKTLVDTTDISETVKEFKQSFYWKLTNNVFNCEILEEKCRRNTVQVTMKEWSGYKNTQDKNEVMTSMEDADVTDYLIPEAVSAADFCEPHHLLSMMRSSLETDRKGITLQYNYSHLHAHLKKIDLDKQYSSHTRVTYACLSYYSTEKREEVGIMCMVKSTPFKYELKLKDSREKRLQILQGKIKNAMH